MKQSNGKLYLFGRRQNSATCYAACDDSAWQERIHLEASAIKCELFEQKAYFELVMMPVRDAGLVATEIEQIFQRVRVL
ncbi:MAG: hypothetical protein ACI9ZF_002904 [Bradyrhizobium sp.]|jgi:hypothetical protein